MKKTDVTCVALVSFAVIVSVYLYSNRNRYSTSNAGNVRIYRTDRKTGTTVLIQGNSEAPVVLSANYAASVPETAEERAIQTAKASRSLSNGFDINSTEIEWRLKKKTGMMRLIGWSAERINEQTYLVKYSFETSDGVRCFPFEVNLEANIVRNVLGDRELERKYGFRTK